jgi:RNA recognition motif-containing protein
MKMEYDIVRKNTFVEVVPKDASADRGRRTRSEPAWSRETTPTRKADFINFEDRSTDIGSDRGSPQATPTLNTRGLNSQPMSWQPAFFWQPCFVDGEQGNMEQQWNSENNNNQFNDNHMFNGNYQWMPNYNGNMPFNGYGDDQYLMDDMQLNPNGEPIDGHHWHMDEHDRRRDGRDGMHWDKRMQGMPGKRKPRANGKHNGGGKVFVGGLASKTTEETLLKVFGQYGNVVHASVLVDATSRRSRGFGYVTFQGEVPECVVDKDHLIDGRMCGARLYKYN